ncbi:MAG: D-alanyl-D-alanine carboxypeptidase family protein, partial [Oscillospiraceae bacterium]|nr:D-alanyl-D-alanine carboxypeptidase family protein [Oscillospiraceae bacterium]
IMSNEETSMEDDRFKNTKAYEWLQENAADYGFILRYPENKEDITGIIYEPWHYRFVGVYYAKLLADKGVTLEEYFEEMNWVDEDGKAVYHLPVLE